MLILGCLIAVVLIVFLSNAAPSPGAGPVPPLEAPSPGAAEAIFGPSEAGPGQGPVVPPTVPSPGPAPIQSAYAPASSSNKDQLMSGETLTDGASITSKNGKFVFSYQFGKAMVKSGTFTMWESTGAPFPDGVLKITNDGNIGIFSSNYSVSPIGWSSATAGRGQAPYILQIRDDGNLVLFDVSNQIVWKPDVKLPPVGVDCAMDEWSEWSICTAPCGGGTQYRTRAILRQGNEGGAQCGPTTETRACNQTPCPDCIVSDWSSWSSCQNPNAAGQGTKTRTKTVTNPGGPGGLECPAPSAMVANESCQNCVYAPWSPAGELNAAPCDSATGLRTQTRTIATAASNGGNPCSEPLQRTQACAVDCQLALITDDAWGACNGTTQTRTVNINTTPKNNGKSCVDAYKAQVSGANVTCSETSCTETRTCAPCVLGTTKVYSTDCPTDNVAGTRKFTYNVVTEAINGGSCSNPEQSEACPVVNCELNPIGADDGWGACDKPCGGGNQTRTRTVKTAPTGGGTACPPLEESRACNTQACPVDATCDWNPCDRACNGKRYKHKQLAAAQNGGRDCPTQFPDPESCNTDNISCSVTAWEGDNGTGRNAKISAGTKTAVGGVGLPNDHIFTVDVPEGMNASVHENGWGLGDGNVAYLNPGRWAPDSWWRNRITSMRAWKTPKDPDYAGWYDAPQNKELQNYNSSDVLTRYNRLTKAECQNKCDFTNGCVGYVSENSGWQNCYILRNRSIPTYDNSNFTMVLRSPSVPATYGVNKCHIFSQRAKQGWTASTGWVFDKNQWGGTSAYDLAADDPACTPN